MRTSIRQLITVGALVLGISQAAMAEYATWQDEGQGTGTGSWPGYIQMPGFDWELWGNIDEYSVSSDNPFDIANAFETAFGDASAASNLMARVPGNGICGGGAGCNDPGEPLQVGLVASIEFNGPTPSSGWGFALADIDVDQVRVRAWDSANNPVSVATIASWFQGTFDASSEDGTNLPYWDPAEAALVGSSALDSTTWHTTIDSTSDDVEAPAGWFTPNISLTRLEFQYESINSSGAPSFHVYLAAREPEIQAPSNPTPVPALGTGSLLLLGLGLAALAYRRIRSRHS